MNIPRADDAEMLLAECLAADEPDRCHRLDRLCTLHPGRSEELRRLYGVLTSFGLDVEPEAVDASPPERLGPYRLLSVLGDGGMGTVHLAVQEGVGRTVALKLMHRGRHASRHARERFRREVLALSRLQHPNICPIYDAGEIDGVPYLAMRHVDGETLEARLGRRREAGGALTREELTFVLTVGEKLARALHSAHGQGLVHRDVKPGNVMLDAGGGEPLLLDFGLARHGDGDDQGLTQSRDRVGTPAYMAPEQVSGSGSDARTDVYALGATLYEALTLHLPHEASTREALYRRILAGDVVHAGRHEPLVPRDLDIVLATALASDPDRRYASAAALADDLARVLRREPILARTAGPWLRFRRFVRRNPLAAAFVASLLAATVVLLWLAEERTRALAGAEAALLAHAAQDTVLHDPVLAMRQAVDAGDGREGNSALYAAVAASRERWRYAGRGVAHGAQFSPDGRKIFARIGNQAVILDARTGAPLQPAIEFPDTVQRAAFDAGSARVLAVGGDRALVDHGGDAPMVLAHPPSPVDGLEGIDAFMSALQRPRPGTLLSAALSPDGATAVTGCSDWSVRVFDAGSGASRVEPLRHEGMPGHLVFRADGRFLATGEGWDVLPSRSGPHHVRVFDVGAGFAPYRVFELPERVQDLDWSPDGRELAVACADGVARLFDVDGDSCRSFPIGSWVWNVRWSPDGDHLLIAARDGSVRVLRRDGSQRSMFTRSEARARWLPDGRRLLAAFGDLTVRIFDLDLRELDVLRGHAGHVLTAEVSPDGRQVVTASFDGTVRVWDLFDPELPLLTGHSGRVVGLAELPDGRIVSVGDDLTLRTWDPRTGEQAEPSIALIDRPWALMLHDDGRRVLCAHWESTAAVYDLVAPAAPPVRFPQPGGFGMAAAWAADGSVWTAGRSSRTFVHAGDGSLRAQLPWAGGQIVAMARSMRGRMAAGGFHGDLALVSDVGEVVRRWRAHQGWIHALAWSRDGLLLASGADDAAVRVWTMDGAEHRRCDGHTGRVMGLSWSPDGALLASASSDGSARIWDVDSAQCVATLRVPGAVGLNAVLWSRDGRFLWTADELGVIRGWPATLDRLRELARSRLERLSEVRR